MPKPPPRDHTTGKVIPHDHEEILDSDKIIRRISVRDVVDNDGQKRLSTMVFTTDNKHEKSIDIKKLIEADEHCPKGYVTTPQFFGAIEIEAGKIRKHGLKVGYEPTKNNPYHGEIWGVINRTVARKLLEDSQWLVPVPGCKIQ